MTPRERAKFVYLEHLPSHRINYDESNVLIDAIEQAILADRQQLQAETVGRLRVEQRTLPTMSRESLAVDRAIAQIQSIFATPDSPGEKPKDTWISIIHLTRGGFRTYCRNEGPTLMEGKLSQVTCKKCLDIFQKENQAESDRRVLAEREACAEIAVLELYEADRHFNEADSSMERQHAEGKRSVANQIQKKIRFRSNPEQGSEPKEAAKESRPLQDHVFIPYAESQCWLCSGNPARHPKTIDALDRIALLTQLIGEQQIKITQLEKEKNEITKQIFEAHEALSCSSDVICRCRYCNEMRGSNNRKA